MNEDLQKRIEAHEQHSLRRAELTKLARTHKCGLCDGSLSVAWSAERRCYVLACKCGHLPEDAPLTKLKGLQQLWKEGVPMHPSIENAFEKREGGE